MPPNAVLRLALVVLLVFAVVVLAAWAGQRRMIYFPDRAAPAVTAPVREVALHTSDGLTLTAWFVPAAGEAGNDRRMAVLVAPGNAGNRGDRLPLATALAAAGFAVLLLDYRGYGGNPGRPSEAGLARDARAARTFLTGTGYRHDRILYFGESLGAAVVAELAVAHPPAGVLLRSPFVDLATVGRHHYPWLPVRRLLRDRFPVARLVERITVPTTIVYGTADSVVPADQSRTVAARVAGPVRVVVVTGADHNDWALAQGDAVVDAVVELA
jgi:fermentation-respiration switch protein FrsA (DUF1100 family)